ncbi:hypothetical protein BASA61_003538 [Batrachochytrium salamandrivorans]|nr:hypothetical protein BASA61_003538 [Batrachochytrium salamandrivorans]KAH9267438.1 hypothetical protein BASA83_009977 [Batrachochytrium salamandrivorans]
MTRDEVLQWFQKRLNRSAEAFDVYQVAKEFYQLGAYSRAMLCLEQYVTLPGATIVGRHLLGYCYLNLGESERSLQGYHDDWQLVVELTLEIEAHRRETTPV